VTVQSLSPPSYDGIKITSIRYAVVFLSEGINNLYSSPIIVRVIKSRRMRLAGYVARMREGIGVYRVLMEKSEGKRPVGRPTRRWLNNINMDL
jgi:hypothetical protein